jgi:signal transduction histidine kinase
MARARYTFSVGALAALGLLVLGSGYLARRALAPVEAVTKTAESVTAKGLNQRINVEQADAEFARLIGVFNDMMARLERSFNQAVRFSADAAHELKTPLTILQGELEAGVQDAPAGSEAQRRYTRLLEEVQRLKAITRKLLLLSLADAGRLTMNRTPVNLSEVVQASIEDVRILAPGLRVEEMVEPGVIVSADADLFRQVIQNLANNAAKYTNDGGNVQFRLSRQRANVIFEVANTGPGIPPSDREKVFDRFYRADKARGRVVEGIGLGLSLAREIARAHGGELTLIDARDGMTAFRLTLPAGSA